MFALALAFPLLTAAPLFQGAAEPEVVERHLGAMGTHLTLAVEAETRAAALQASEAAVRAIEAVEQRLSTWRESSELARLNTAPAKEQVTLSPELSADLSRARTLWRETDGAFDPGVGALVKAWGLREGGRVPTDQELEAALAAGGLGALLLGESSATRLRSGLTIEEGGFGKGVALDAALLSLKDSGVQNATVDLGGQVAVLRSDIEKPVHYAVAHPRDRARAVAELTLSRGSLATSGNSERGIVINGRQASPHPRSAHGANRLRTLAASRFGPRMRRRRTPCRPDSS